MNEKNLELILALKNMKKLSVICREHNINYSNLVQGKSSKENEKLIADEIKKEIVKLIDVFIIGG